MNKNILKHELVINEQLLKQATSTKDIIELLNQRASLKDLLISVLEEENSQLQKAG